ncbi:MAG TPA: DoxX family protein [Thermomicrobiales bacterium]|nr:DoxX family protein [Thermomicrobiales bacterium]
MDGNREKRSGRQADVIQAPPVAQVLFGNSRLAWLWLVARVYLGWLWLDAGRQKLAEDGWMDGGLALRGIWERSIQTPEQEQAPLAYSWYHDMLQFMLDHKWYVWAGPLVAVGETLLGIALILGFFTGLTAFLGSLLNAGIVLTGAAANPFFFVLAIALMLAWRTAGLIGLDRWVLPLSGKIWSGDIGPPDRSGANQRGHSARAAG